MTHPHTTQPYATATCPRCLARCTTTEDVCRLAAGLVCVDCYLAEPRARIESCRSRESPTT